MSQMIESFMNADAGASLSAQRLELEEAATQPPAGPPLLHGAHPLHAVKVQLHVRVGTVVMTLGELLEARERQVLRLERTVEDPVDLVLDDRVVARGELMAVDGSFAVRITELPLPLGL
jgi:flagellar motor switch protein FliN/FliY